MGEACRRRPGNLPPSKCSFSSGRSLERRAMRHEGKHLQAVAVRDRLLQLVAKRMTDTVREADIVARVGGDEFVVAAQFSRDIPSSFDEDAVDVIDATRRLFAVQ